MTKAITKITLDIPNVKDFAAARNLLLRQVTTDWAFFVDQDEIVSTKLQAEIDQAVHDKRYNYAFKRQDIFLGRKLLFGETSKVRLTRLVQPGTGKWQGKVHESFISTLPVKTLKNPLIHDRHITISEFFKRLDFYSTLRAKELHQSGKKFSLPTLLFYPSLKFMLNYFIYLGFLDGFAGLTMAFTMSLHSLFVRIKLYELHHSR